MVVKKAKPKERAKSSNLPASRDPLDIYLQQIRKYPVLSKKEEHQFAIRAIDLKDREALQALIKANLRFVVKLAFQYSKYGAKVLDLIQEGNVGLLRAVREYSPYKDTRLSTYAVWWIRSYMQDFLLRNWSLVRIGTTKAQKKLFYRLKKEQEKLERDGISPTPQAIAMNLGVGEADVELMQNRMRAKDASLSTPINDDSQSATWESQLPGETSMVSDQLEESEQALLFKKALTEFTPLLDERELDIFNNRLMSESPMTLLEIGKRYDFSKERARQIEERIKKKLKEFLSENYPDISVD